MNRAAVVAVATPLAAVPPLWLMFSWLFEVVTIDRHGALVAVPLGLTAMALVLAVPAMLWAAVVARITGADRRAVTRTTLRTALPLALLVGGAVDLSQLFIDTVHPWHDLAVHALFAVAFAVGLATLLGTVAWRVARVVTQPLDAPRRVPARVGALVALASAVGVVGGAALALPLGWQVQPWMGSRMLAPMYLVLVTGTTGGGIALGRTLVAR